MATNNATNTPTLTANGQIFIGSAGNNPVAATITAGPGITVTNAAGAITLSTSSYFPVVNQTTTPVTMAPNTAYVTACASLLTYKMPAAVAVGTVFSIVGQASTGWFLQLNAGQTANIGNSATTAAGHLSSTSATDCIEIMCTVANTTFNVISSMGNITYA